MKNSILLVLIALSFVSKAQYKKVDTPFFIPNNIVLTNRYVDSGASLGRLHRPSPMAWAIGTMALSDRDGRVEWRYAGYKYDVWNYRPVPQHGYYADTVVGNHQVHYVVFYNAEMVFSAKFVPCSSQQIDLRVDSNFLKELELR